LRALHEQEEVLVLPEKKTTIRHTRLAHLTSENLDNLLPGTAMTSYANQLVGYTLKNYESDPESPFSRTTHGDFTEVKTPPVSKKDSPHQSLNE
jgi:hypothetical protein